MCQIVQLRLWSMGPSIPLLVCGPLCLSILLALRALQSLGASAVLAVAYGVVADVCLPAERGRMLGAVMAASNLGLCIACLVVGSRTLAAGSRGFLTAGGLWHIVLGHCHTCIA